MSKTSNHIDFERDFFKKASIQYSKSKEDVWADMESKLTEMPESKILKIDFMKVIRYSAAAVLIIGLGLSSFFRLYSVSVYCPNGQHTKVELPDGSKITLNANSELTYHPYWWRFSRKLDFKGEGFFEVTKGKKFIVVSEKALTTVLGTSFNIYFRDNEYRVNCFTGKVMVNTINNESTVLVKNEYTIVDKANKLVKSKDDISNKNSIAWINNEFVFTSMPLQEIYEEIERQYDIVISGKENVVGISSFNSSRGSSAEEIINLIGKPHGVKCIKISDKNYIIEQK
jgi:ferric-dicitrate binding protein FerR (iron transport regulator)